MFVSIKYVSESSTTMWGTFLGCISHGIRLVEYEDVIYAGIAGKP